MRFGGQLGSSLFGYAGVGFPRPSEINGSGVNLNILPFTTGNTASPCWPTASRAYNWPYIQPSQPTGSCDGGCSAQIHLASTLPSSSFVTITTELKVFPNSLAADAALASESPLFYCMGTHQADPSVYQNIPISQRQVIAAFTGAPVVSTPPTLPPFTCPCLNGGVCANGEFGGACTCDSNHWGSLCQYQCNCVNGACDPVFGNCTCSEGVNCGATCGTLCSSICPMPHGYCDPKTCQCLCAPTYHGVDCSRKYACPNGRSDPAENTIKNPRG